MDGNTVTDFVHPLRASHASPSLREGEDTPPTTNLRQTPFNSPLHIKGEAATSPSRSEGDACKRSAARRGCTKHHHLLNPL